MKKRISFLLWTSVPLGIIVVVAGMFLYQLMGPGVSLNKTSEKIYIPTNATFGQVVGILSPHLDHNKAFVWWARFMNYDRQVKPGCYKIQNKQSVYDLVLMLRSGRQVEVRLSFNASSSVQRIFERIAKQIEPTQNVLQEVFENPHFLKSKGFDRNSVVSILIPNTYHLFWNTSPTKFRNRMLMEYHSFWNEQRKTKAAQLDLTPLEVSTLASIVERETSKGDEMPKVAGLYINRLQKGIHLQADPTVVFALKQEMGCDTCTIRRVLLKDLKINSPYNTYQNKGLPPAPIGIPSIKSIDAVLNHQKHRYIFMCASTERSGYHEFAVSLKAHNINRAKYTRWLNSQKIYR